MNTLGMKGDKSREKETVQVDDEHAEAVAMDTFRQRITLHRASMPQTYETYARTPMAPGFDYIHWKPYGMVRYHYRNNPDEYPLMAAALAPYVRCVVESGCQGQEETRWQSMTVPAHQVENMRRTGSREGFLDTSRDQI